jgi:hypothetical protein
MAATPDPRSNTYPFPSALAPVVEPGRLPGQKDVAFLITQPWYRLLISFQRIGIGRQAVTLGASPAIFTTNRNGLFVSPSGQIEISRDYVINPSTATWDVVTTSGGSVAILARDSVRVTYSGSAPGASFYADS